jgi:type I restriction enzyme R subunit
MPTPEDQAREHIDQALEKAGWRVQDYKSANLQAGRGIVLRNFPLVSGHGFADYLLYVDGKAAGIINYEPMANLFNAVIERTLQIHGK